MLMLNNKNYKGRITVFISSLWTVSMLPGNRNGLPDVFYLLFSLNKKENIEVILYTYFDRKRNSHFSRYNNLLKYCNKWVRLDEKVFEDSYLDKLEEKGFKK